jgi:hypothetical protein
MVVEPHREIRGAAHDEGVALCGLTVEVSVIRNWGYWIGKMPRQSLLLGAIITCAF